jgi:(heptosyl)LPS beta-1,4-glucosyltransferase
MQPVTLAIALVTFNEADLLPPCLAAVNGQDQLIVVDLGSTDQSRQLAVEAGADVVDAPWVPVVERIRQVAVDHNRCDWLLFLDPDERLPAGYVDSLKTLLSQGSADNHAAYWIEFVEHFFGTPVPTASSGVGKVALFRAGHVRFHDDAVAHSWPDIDGSVGSLMGKLTPIEHHSSRSVDQVIEKLGRYARSGGSATDEFRPDDPWVLVKLLFRGIITRRAWRDGAHGIASVSVTSMADYFGFLTRWEAAGQPERPLTGRERRLLTTTERLEKLRQRVRRSRGD